MLNVMFAALLGSFSLGLVGCLCPTDSQDLSQAMGGLVSFAHHRFRVCGVA